MEEHNPMYLSDYHIPMVRKYCFGCTFFNPAIKAGEMCTIVGWYIDYVSSNISFKEFIDYIKGCPCNKKCLVKVSCRDEKCPMWMKYVRSLQERRVHEIQKRIREKNEL